MFQAFCKLGLEGIVSKRLNAPYKSGPSKAWLKIKNPNAPAATQVIDGTLWRDVMGRQVRCCCRYALWLKALEMPFWQILLLSVWHCSCLAAAATVPWMILKEQN
jgi:hypothetical protein